MPVAATPDLLPPAVRRMAWWYLLLTALFIVLIGWYTNVDLWLARQMYDSTSRSFPWRHAWLTEQFGHVILKRVLTVGALIPIVLCLGEIVLRRAYLTAWSRLRLRFLALCAILIPAVISLLKQTSKSHCPWDLEQFGGNQIYFRLLDHVPAWIEAGKCLPGGHASSALWLVGIVVFWLPNHPRRAALAGGIALLLGAILGWMQQMRGAHFLTHTLWSMWIASALVMALLSAWHYRLESSRSSRFNDRSSTRSLP